MRPVDPIGVLNSDAIPGAPKGGAISGVGTGGGKNKVETTHYLKDNEVGGALPDTREGLDVAARAKHYRNEKAMEGTLTLVRGFPQINAGDKITILGVGPVFSGAWIVKTHTLSISREGCHSVLELTRNAVGKSGGGSETSGGLETNKRKSPNAALSEDDFAEM